MRVWGFIFLDLEGDGVRALDDPGLDDITVELRDPNLGQVWYVAHSTEPQGYFLFQDQEGQGNVAPGYYELYAQVPYTYEVTTAYPVYLEIDECRDYGYVNVGVRPLPTPTPTPTHTPTFTPTPTATPRTGRVEGYVWEDTNRDGIMQEEEPGVEGLTLVLSTIQGRRATTAQEWTTVTDANGFYRFENIPAGSLVLWVERRTGYHPTTQAQTAVPVQANRVTTVSFGLYPLSYRAYLGMIIR